MLDTLVGVVLYQYPNLGRYLMLTVPA